MRKVGVDLRRTSIMKEYVAYTVKDVPGKVASVFYVPPIMCNLNCYHCHNRAGFNKAEFFSVEEIDAELDKLRLLGVEVFVISGGEPLLVAERIPFSIFADAGPTRVDTNGTLPEKVELYAPFVHGFAVDVKVPIREKYSKEEKERFEKILFWNKVRTMSVEEYADKVRRTLEFLAENKMPLTLTRTVEYPLLTKEEIEEISKFVRKLGLSHQVNPFYYTEKEG